MPEIAGYLIERRHLAMVAQAVLAFAKARKLAGSPLPADQLAEVEAIARAAVGSPTVATTSASGSEIRTPAEVRPVLNREQWATVDQVAGLMGCTTSWVRQQLRSGELVGRKVGNTWLIDRASLDRKGSA